MHSVVVYSREGCCLCDVVKQTLAAVQSNAAEQGADFQWREVDIDADPELRRKYNDEIPVVFIDGRKAFKYRMSGPELLRALKESNPEEDAVIPPQPVDAAGRRL